ncbi:hypothetical protein Tco_0489284 [Tanacetum coccineum]
MLSKMSAVLTADIQADALDKSAKTKMQVTLVVFLALDSLNESVRTLKQENTTPRNARIKNLKDLKEQKLPVAKDIWERVQLLMQGTSLKKQERECKLYDEFDKFAYMKGESLHQCYLRFAQLINNMNIYKMTLQQFQVNNKFLNSLPPEWSKFFTDVKLVRDSHTTNFDQLHAYLQQHELHANEILIMRERNQDPLALIANHQQTPSHFNTY